MSPRIVSIGTAVPTTRVAQTEARDFFATQPGVDRLTARLIRAAFDAAEIERATSIAWSRDQLPLITSSSGPNVVP